MFPVIKKSLTVLLVACIVSGVAMGSMDKGKSVERLRALVTTMIDNGSDMDMTIDKQNGWSALHMACVIGDVDTVKRLIDAHANINIDDNNGWTPLHDAAFCGQIKIVNALIAAGANVKAVNKNGKIPFQLMKMKNQEEMVELLISLSAQ